MNRTRQSVLNTWAPLSILIALTACGGGGGEGGPVPLAMVSTLAYVVTECHADAQGGTIRQSLQIRRGEQAPIPVVEHFAVGAGGVRDACQSAGADRQGFFFTEYGVFHRLGVTPDGSQVVFEVTDDDPPAPIAGGDELQTVFPPHALPAEQKGIFAVRADGTGLRRLGPASRESPVDIDIRPFFAFSPNGRTIAYTDRGPSRDNQDAVQIFTLDLATGDAGPVTQLPPAGPGGTYGPVFTDDQTIAFFTSANADGLNPAGEIISATVKTTDPTHMLTVASPPVAIPGSEVLTSFRITGSEVNVANLILPGEPVNGGSFPGFPIQEAFVIDRENDVLQLTNFRRVDTVNPTLSADGQRVVFCASTNRLGTNPTENGQLFSIDRTGGDLRQLTDFHEVPEGGLSTAGCFIGPPPFGCGANYMSRDTQSNAVVFYSNCDPFGTNPYGDQVFAMHSDGTGLRQLTHTQGYTKDASGAVTVEVAYPFAYPGLAIVYNFIQNH
jgi:WD40 repeat protein